MFYHVVQMPPSAPHGKCVFSLFKVIAFFVFVVSCDKASSSLEQGNTLGKPPSKQLLRVNSRRSLFGDHQKKVNETQDIKELSCSWSIEEVALVQYICLYWPEACPDQWQKHKDNTFWTIAHYL